MFPRTASATLRVDATIELKTMFVGVLVTAENANASNSVSYILSFSQF